MQDIWTIAARIEAGAYESAEEAAGWQEISVWAKEIRWYGMFVQTKAVANGRKMFVQTEVVGILTEKRYAGENGGNQAGDLCADRDTVTVVLAADQAYVPVLSVCIASIVRTCDTYISDKVTDDKVTDDKVTIDKATIEDTASHTAAARPGEARKYRICIFHTDIQQKRFVTYSVHIRRSIFRSRLLTFRKWSGAAG